MIYLVCFAASTALAYYANKTGDRKRFILLSVLSILIPVTLAGLRHYRVGIDTINYMYYQQYWYGATAYRSFWEYMRYYLSIDCGEVLFAVILGIVARITDNFTVFLFVAHTVIITGVYIGAVRQKKHVNPAVILLLFYLLFFNHSLNVTRQYMAMAIVFAAFGDIEQKKYLRYVIVVIVATLIHNSAILGFAPLVIYLVMYYDFGNLKLKWNPSLNERKQLIVGGLALLVVFFPLLCRMLIWSGLLFDKYLFFLGNPEKIQPTTMISLFLIVELAAVFVFRKRIKEKFKSFDYYLICSVAYLILHQLSNTIVYGKRVAAYLSLINITTIAMIPASLDMEKVEYTFGKVKVSIKNVKMIAHIAVVAVAVFYWWYSYVLRNASGTYPYVWIFSHL